MLAYPPLAHALGLTAHQAGVFFGLSIHDVAQVAGAGASVSPETASTAALAKLARIVWLGPMVVLIGFVLARSKEGGVAAGLKAPPLFVLGFAAFRCSARTGMASACPGLDPGGLLQLPAVGGRWRDLGRWGPRPCLKLSRSWP
ncbi:putative sulfate exporter family transporter [Caulobacter segnis]